MLRLFAEVFLNLVAFLFGSGLDKFLLNQIFKVSKRSGSSLVEEFRNRKPVAAGWSLSCLSCRTNRYKTMKKGLERIEKEQDFVNFVKKSIMIDAALKVIFSRTERFLLKNQA